MSTPTTVHWAPKVSEISRTSSGRATAAELTLTLSAPRRSSRRASSSVRTPPPDCERDEDLFRRARDDVQHRRAAFGRGGYVVKDDLVGPFGVVTGGQLDRVAGVAEAARTARP